MDSLQLLSSASFKQMEYCMNHNLCMKRLKTGFGKINQVIIGAAAAFIRDCYSPPPARFIQASASGG